MEKIRLQSCVWPTDDIDNALYSHIDKNVYADIEKREYTIEENSICCFDTYFNSLSAGKWKKYTLVNQLGVEVVLKGCARIRIINRMASAESHKESILLDEAVNNSEFKNVISWEFEFPANGIVYIEVKAVKDVVLLRDFSFYTNIENALCQEVFLGAVICTYKREAYVEKNLRKIERCILTNFKSPLYGKLFVFVSDNGQTLDLQVEKNIIIKPNLNLGGVGGFTRGMIEMLDKNEKRQTHIVLMDDDAIIEPYVLERTYMFLRLMKSEYRDYALAGALIRKDKMQIQFESGAQWNRGKIKTLKPNLNLKNVEDLIINEDENETIEYAGWWYSCMPVSRIRKIGLPLPLFIHRDDIEYGLRFKGQFITLNGIGIWHEPYENKMPGVLEYYDLRNLAIVNIVHYPDYTPLELKKMICKWVSGNIARYRYQYVDLNLKGIEDFCRGYEAFKEQDPILLHQELRDMDYKQEQIECLVRQCQIDGKSILRECEQAPINKLRKIWRIATANGALFPAKRNMVIMVRPYCNVYALYRYRQVIFADTVGKGILVKRNLLKSLQCYYRLSQIMRLVDRSFEKNRKEYRENYAELCSHKFWYDYLNLQENRRSVE